MQIGTHLASQLDVEIESISRTIYRDLNELVDNNEIRVHYFNRDGEEISDYDSAVHKNTYCEWSLIGNESLIIGQDILKENGALLLASERLNKSLRIDTAVGDIGFGTIQIYFNIPHHFICLRIAKEALPFNVVIGRISANTANPAAMFKSIEDRFGKRTIMLSLPYSSISSFKPEIDQLGHSLLRFDTNDDGLTEEILLSDLKSKNKTYFCKLSQVEADSIRKIRIESADRTLTEGWDHLTKIDLHIKKTEVCSQIVTLSPSLVFVSEQTPVLVA
ncbi:MAG: hypothetical protein ACXVCP_08385 [Bdellovibrio sp.]